jgi:alkaline phosphatase D
MKTLSTRVAFAALLLPPTVLATVLSAPALGQERVSLPPQLTGPMVGSVTPGEATIWLYTEAKPEVIVNFRAASEPAERIQAVRPKPDEGQHNAIKARLTGLRAATTYQYEVLLDGRGDPVWNGQFSTPPVAGKSSRFKVAVTSCMDYTKMPVQPAWFLLLAEKPDLQLLLGDNVNANTTDRERLWAMHRQQRRVVEFAAVLRNVPSYAMWDDHDYGPNNSDGTLAGKDNSLAAFKELFANPSAGTSGTPGAFFRFSWGDVDFFMLDGRYHRSPDDAPNDANKRMLGDAQFKWLAEGLRESKAKFKVRASGSTLMASRDDGWRIYDFDRKRHFQTIMDQKISGAIYLSGDIHRCQLDVHPASETGGYPLYEVTSSGIANSRTQGFATLEFDTTDADPSLRIKIIHGDATTRLDRTLRLSELKAR